MKKHRKKRKPFTSYVDSRVWYFMERRAGDPKRQRAVVASWHKARYEALPEARRRYNRAIRIRNRSLLRKQRKERRVVLMEEFKEEKARKEAEFWGRMSGRSGGERLGGELASVIIIGEGQGEQKEE